MCMCMVRFEKKKIDDVKVCDDSFIVFTTKLCVCVLQLVCVCSTLDCVCVHSFDILIVCSQLECDCVPSLIVLTACVFPQTDCVCVDGLIVCVLSA